MLLKSGDIAFAGFMTAIAVLLIVLSGVFENCSLFLLAAASFLTGVVQRRISLLGAGAFLMASMMLGVFLASNKLYCFTFLVFGIYILFAEWTESYRNKGKRVGVWIGKAAVYHILLIVSVLFFQYVIGFDILLPTSQMRLMQKMPALFGVVAVIAAEVVWILFDRAYFYFQWRYGRWFHLEQ